MQAPRSTSKIGGQGPHPAELAHSGAVTFIQRFDSALRLNPHPHTLALDGVYVRGDDGQLDFHPLPAPSAEEVADVARPARSGPPRAALSRQIRGRRHQPWYAGRSMV